MSLREGWGLAKAAANVKILTIDLERFPGKWYAWGPKVDYLSSTMMIEPPRTICFGAKWLHERKPFTVDERVGHEAMIRAAWELLSEADIAITYNGSKADIPWLQNDFAIYGLGKAAPFKHVDLIKVNRQNLDLPYRSLDYLAGRLLGTRKIKTDFDLWLGCEAGDEKSWSKMLRYCAKDVSITEDAYLELLPWLDGQAHIGLMIGDGEAWRCWACGRVLTAEHKWAKSARAFVREYDLYRCSCLAWNRSTFLKGTAQRTRPVK